MLFNYTNVINCLIISFFCAVLFPVHLVTKRAILELASRASFLVDFSARLVWSMLNHETTLAQRFLFFGVLRQQ